MFKLLKNGHCFIPDDVGQKDILIVNDVIYAIKDKISLESTWDAEIIDCRNCMVCPGFIDQHVHILGGGGEQGPASRIPELNISEVLKSGVTTLVGVLGFDSISRNIAGLLFKARALEAEGITAYIYTGSYRCPTDTLTGKVITDLALIDKVIGVGEIAIADYRSSYSSFTELKILASETNAGGMLGAKAGVLHLHVGDGKEGLEPVFKLIDETDLPVTMFVPTHINRNKKVFTQGLELLHKGGNIDLTAGETIGKSVPESLKYLIENGINLDRVTISSDGNGSVPTPGKDSGGAKMDNLINDLRKCIIDLKLNFASIIKTVTINPAKILKLYPRKGCLFPGSDADVLVLNEKDLSISHLLTRGQIAVKEQTIIKNNKYEQLYDK